MKLIKVILLAVGFYVLVLTIQNVGAGRILENIAQLRWKLLPVLAFYFFVYAFNALGWLYAFAKPLAPMVAFRDIYFIRIIGETLNSVVPFSASVGGEPVKVELLKRRFAIPLSEGYASILIVHTTLWASLNLFVIGAIAINLNTLPLTPLLWKCVLAFLVLLGIGAAGLLVGLHYGIFKRVYAFGEHFKLWHESHKEIKTKFLKLDDEIKRFYTKNRRRFFLSVLFNFFGWFVGVFEVYYTAKILGIPIGLSEAWLLEAMIQILRIMTFMIPSSIGAQEGGIMLLFSQFGLAPSLSLTFALIRRLREILWIAIGLLLWLTFEDHKTVAAE
jgi:glycosyltransferase 2 family protein